MSTPSATARYVITADDKTKSAIASIRNGFKSMESNVKATVSRINLAFGLIAGGSLKRTLQSVFTETAKGSKEFSAALDDVRHSARRLLAAKEGAPAAAAAMRELAAVLKDPEFQAAADKIATALVQGFTGTVKFVTGVKSLREEIEELKRQRDELVKSASQGGNRPRRYIQGEPQFIENDDRAQVYAKTLQIEQKEKQLREQETAAARRQEEMWARIDAAGDKATRRFETMRQLQENIKFFEDLEREGSDEQFFEDLARKSENAAARMRESFFESIEKDASNVGETLQRTGDSIDEVGERIGENIGVMSQWSVYADEAARNIQSAFADFLFDPFEDGLKGMLKGFIDVIRRMIAEAAAAKIFASKSSGGFGVGDWLSGLFGGVMGAGGGASSGIVEGEHSWMDNLFGGMFGGGGSAPSGGNWSGPRATGGPVRAGGLYRVNENEMEFFRPNLGGQVIPLSKMGDGMGGGTVLNLSINNDNRGATSDFIRQLPEHDRRLAQQIETTIVTKLRRRQYNLG